MTIMWVRSLKRTPDGTRGRWHIEVNRKTVCGRPSDNWRFRFKSDELEPSEYEVCAMCCQARYVVNVDEPIPFVVAGRVA